MGMTVRYPDGILKFYPLPCQSLCHVCRTRVGKYTCVACGVGPLCNLHCTGISASFPRIRRGKKPWAPFVHVFFGCRNYYTNKSHTVVLCCTTACTKMYDEVKRVNEGRIRLRLDINRPVV